MCQLQPSLAFDVRFVAKIKKESMQLIGQIRQKI
jgi:hypothetical protein